jgi:DNA-directed RNA polymerase sigma subunit (sigma70/sigma32)
MSSAIAQYRKQLPNLGVAMEKAIAAEAMRSSQGAAVVKLSFSGEWRSLRQNCCILLFQGEKLDPAEILGVKMSKTQNDSDAVGFLLKSAGKFPMLSGDQEIELGRQVQAMMRVLELLENERPEDSPVIVNRGQRAKNQMIQSNLRLVIKVQ